MDEKPIKFAQAMFDYHQGESEFTDALVDAGFGEYERIGGDYYDCSIEFYKVDDDLRMSPEAQKIVRDAGFAKAYVNHKDGWETHYSWDWRSSEFKADRGWRRRYVKDPTCTTTNQVGADDPDKRGYYEISYWPDGWSHKEWLDTGYMRIVPDPLEITVEPTPAVME